MKILVTGALGFIGSNITERLVKEGHEVTALDNYMTGSDENIAAVKDRVRVVKAEAGEVASLGEKYDVILHQGVYSSSPMYKENRHLTAKALDEMVSILEYAKDNETKVVFASSSSLYNKNPPPHREDMQIQITDFYTEARYAMERVSNLYHQLYGVKVIGLRYFSVYGPHEGSKGKYANLITQFLWSLQKNEAPVIFGDGQQTRDFTYVDDVVEANMLAMKSGKASGIYNVGTGSATSINDMLMLLKSKTGKDLEPTYIENKIKNYVAHTQADTTLAESELGFRARVSLDEGIGKLVEHYS
ncbi:MAG: NAD-dependent epimerase/dehydratase family protein [Candidatus Micrarchaeota archaeon]